MISLAQTREMEIQTSAGKYVEQSKNRWNEELQDFPSTWKKYEAILPNEIRMYSIVTKRGQIFSKIKGTPLFAAGGSSRLKPVYSFPSKEIMMRAAKKIKSDIRGRYIAQIISEVQGEGVYEVFLTYLIEPSGIKN